ncbi:MAG: hypothetical protein ACREJC_10140, partial [Tepidisphaeraceae bacterium]
MDLRSFEVIGPIERIATIAVRRSIRELRNLRKLFGPGRWRKLKGIATVRFSNGMMFRAELHWYEAHGVGKRKLKIK